MTRVLSTETARTSIDRMRAIINNGLAVLITAFLGAAMWVVFNNLMSSASDTACDQVATIGSSGTTGGGCDTTSN